MRVPVATYRVQFNRGFRFSEARALSPFLRDLGITDLYSSPISRARQGSTHGYDVTDPLQLNPELGGDEEFQSLAEELQRLGMGLIVDIVPNHMAASSENPWWMDVLENGAGSPYASYFNIEWHPDPARGREPKVLLPILGGPFGSVLENQELTLALDEGGFFIRYFEARLPVDPKSYRMILSYRLERLEGSPELGEILEWIDRLPPRTATDSETAERRRREKEIIPRRIWSLFRSDPRVKDFIDESLRIFNGVKGD